MDNRLTIRLLGPLEIVRAGEPAPLGGPRLRALLVYLVLHRQRAVPTERILTDLWGPDAGDSARRSLHTQVSTLRKRLASPDGSIAIERDGLGYRLHSEQACIDLDDFERLSSAATADNDGQAAAQALALWRGDPLQDVADEPWAQATVAELRERWSQLLLLDLDARLDDGRHQELVSEINALIESDPYSEPLWERLLIALYRSGRQADALEQYRRLEETLREELGLEPGPALQKLQRRILLHDPTLLPTSSAPHKVPGTLAAFIGRDAELTWLSSLVRDHRLITVLGPGGVGKTRTVIELAHRQRGRRAGGIWFVDFAPIREEGRVLEVLAQSLDVHAVPGEELPAVRAYIAERETLIVLDNCEHLRVEVARAVTDLLASAPLLRVVVTSRIALGIAGEVTWTLPPLEVPGDDDDLSTAAERDAVRLFVERVAAVRPAFRLGASNAGTVTRLCRRLDGLPLALELAATRMRSLGVSEIASHLDRNLDLLRSPDPGVDDRHRTLTAVLSWSTDLLDDATRVVHARLSVLPDSFDAVLATAVSGLSEVETVNHLDALVASSLLVADHADAPTRYRMLEVVRDHAAALLEALGERRDAEVGLLSWALQVSEPATIKPDSTEPPEGLHLLPTAWVRRLAKDAHNLRAALAVATRDAVVGLTLATRLTSYWWANAGTPDRSSGNLMPAVREGISWLERLIALADPDVRRRDGAEVALGFLRAISGDRRRALSDLLAVRERLDGRGQLRAAGWASMYAATASWDILPAAATTRLYQEARRRFARTGEFQGQVLLSGLEIGHAIAADDPGAAAEIRDRFLALTETAASPSVAMYRDILTAWTALLDGDEQAARRLLQPVYERRPNLSDPVTTILLLATGAWWAALAGHQQTALDLLTVCDAVETRSGLDLHFVRGVGDRAERCLSAGRTQLPQKPLPEDWDETMVLDAFYDLRAHLAGVPAQPERLSPSAEAP